MSTFALTEPWWHYAARGVMTYAGLLLFMRLNGKRAFGEMSAFDVIVLVLVGGALRSAIVGDDKSITAPFIGVAFILLTDRCLAWCCARSSRFNRWVEGMPTTLVVNGQRDPSALRKENLPEAVFERVLHQHGWQDERHVTIGRLEPNGKITFVQAAKPAKDS